MQFTAKELSEVEFGGNTIVDMFNFTFFIVSRIAVWAETFCNYVILA